MNKLVTPFRVGLLVLAAGAFLFVFLTFVRKGGMSEQESIDVYAYFHDASGLGKRSRVQIAGIPVGEIRKIELEGNRA
ncbi:MAG TPA: MlaD family protein, partial [Myxococcaceae bacterium]|nr:MlaD family protein [Myxococcaceae bacterium]